MDVSPSEGQTKRNLASTRRYGLVLPEKLFNEVQNVADEEGITMVEFIRRSIKLGLLAAQIQENPNAALIIREDNTEREIMFI